MTIFRNRVADHFQRQISSYVPNMAFADEVNQNGVYRVDLGVPEAADPDGILDGEVVTLAGSTTTFLSSVADATYGRNVTIVNSAANTAVITIRGRDYLGQPVAENITSNGTNPVVGKKAFKWIDRISWAVASTGTPALDVGFGTALGLPYKTIKVLSEEDNGVVVGTLGVLTAPVLTDPQTATTGDPRGTIVAQTSLDGTNRLTFTLIANNSSNAAGNGGLHGIRHFFA